MIPIFLAVDRESQKLLRRVRNGQALRVAFGKACCWPPAGLLPLHLTAAQHRCAPSLKYIFFCWPTSTATSLLATSVQHPIHANPGDGTRRRYNLQPCFLACHGGPFLRTFLRRLTPRIFCDTCATTQAFSGCTRTEATAAGGCGLTSLAFLLRPAALSLAWPHTPSPRASLLRQHELLHLEELRSRQLPKHAVRCSNSFVSAMHCNCHPGAGQTLTLQNGCVKEKTQPHQRLTAKPPSIFCRSSGKLIRTHAHVLSPESSCARRSLRLNVAPLPATCPLRVRGL